MSGADLIAEYGVTLSVTRYANSIQSLDLVFDADFVTGNAINMQIDGVAITEVPFSVNQATTLTNLATEIQNQSTIDTAVVSGVRTISIVGLDPGTEIVIAKIVVTGGATQPNASIANRIGGYVDGKFDPGAETSFDIVMSAQPLVGKELQLLPEGERTRRFIKGYTATRLYTASEAGGRKADRVSYDGADFEVQTVENWPGDLSHYKVLMAEVNSE